jgi:hypothetical protein
MRNNASKATTSTKQRLKNDNTFTKQNRHELCMEMKQQK